ncbi:MAG: head decoration protein [Candidatus Adiutrix sp.]|jgi:hypothetical protein|nr:head decoration protein [Candidatus Adiutrix sp.]
MPLRSYTEDGASTLSSVLLVEVNPRWCRENITLAPTEMDLPIGMVLVKTADGDYVPYLASEENTEASAVLITDATASDEQQPAVAVKRGAVVNHGNLLFLEPVTEEQQAVALEQLTALGIVPQE